MLRHRTLELKHRVGALAADRARCLRQHARVDFVCGHRARSHERGRLYRRRVERPRRERIRRRRNHHRLARGRELPVRRSDRYRRARRDIRVRLERVGRCAVRAVERHLVRAGVERRRACSRKRLRRERGARLQVDRRRRACHLRDGIAVLGERDVAGGGKSKSRGRDYAIVLRDRAASRDGERSSGYSVKGDSVLVRDRDRAASNADGTEVVIGVAERHRVGSGIDRSRARDRGRRVLGDRAASRDGERSSGYSVKGDSVLVRDRDRAASNADGTEVVIGVAERHRVGSGIDRSRARDRGRRALRHRTGGSHRQARGLRRVERERAVGIDHRHRACRASLADHADRAELVAIIVEGDRCVVRDPHIRRTNIRSRALRNPASRFHNEGDSFDCAERKIAVRVLHPDGIALTLERADLVGERPERYILRHVAVFRGHVESASLDDVALRHRALGGHRESPGLRRADLEAAVDVVHRDGRAFALKGADLVGERPERYVLRHVAVLRRHVESASLDDAALRHRALGGHRESPGLRRAELEAAVDVVHRDGRAFALEGADLVGERPERYVPRRVAVFRGDVERPGLDCAALANIALRRHRQRSGLRRAELETTGRGIRDCHRANTVLVSIVHGAAVSGNCHRAKLVGGTFQRHIRAVNDIHHDGGGFDGSAGRLTDGRRLRASLSDGQSCDVGNRSASLRKVAVNV